MAVQRAHRRVAEQHRPAAVRLQAVLVRVDHHRVARGHRPQPGRRLGAEELGAVVVAGQQGEEPAVGGVDVQPAAVAVAQGQRLGDRVDRPQAGGAGGQHHRPHPARGQQLLEGVQVHPPGHIGGHGHALDPQHLAHAGVGVMGVLAVGDRPAGGELAGHPERLQVGDGAAGGEVAEAVGREAEHGRQVADDLLLHGAGGRPAVQGVVVGVDGHRGQVAGQRHRVGRLEHLAGVAGMEERVVVLQAPGVLGPGGGQAAGVDLGRGGGPDRLPAGPEPPVEGAGRVQVGAKVHGQLLRGRIEMRPRSLRDRPVPGCYVARPACTRPGRRHQAHEGASGPASPLRLVRAGAPLL